MNAASAVFIESVGVAAPGLPDWLATRSALANGQDYVAAEFQRYAPNLLPPNERRRATSICRLAFQVAEEALRGSSISPQEMGAVFASSGGDTEVMDRQCKVLATAERTMSPIDFHNSVHNAPAGYWSIATGSRMPSTSLSAFDSSFAAGLLEAASMVRAESMPVLLACYDIRPPLPLWHSRPLEAPFGVSFILAAERGSDSLAHLEMLGISADAETSMQGAALEKLRTGNPAARSLPLLLALARGEAREVALPYLGRCLRIGVSPC
jgi:hypothetical protein